MDPGAPSADTMVPAGDPRLAQPSDVAVGPDGAIYLADQGANQVVVLAPNGTELRRIGREGAGPGELRQPRSLTVAGDSIRLADVGNDRINVYSLSGSFGRSFSGLPALVVAGVAFNGRGEGLLARHGLGGMLAQRIEATGALGRPLGRPLAAPDQAVDFGQLKADLVAGRIPPSLVNYSAPALSPGGDAWVLLIVEGRVQRYAADDSLRWERALPDTLRGRLREGLFAAARRDTLPNHFPFPSLFVAARGIGSDLWILLQAPAGEGARLAVLDSAGRWTRFVQVRGASNIRAFAVDSASGALYLLDPAEGTLLRAQLPPR